MPRKEDRVHRLARDPATRELRFTDFAGNDELVQRFRAGEPAALDLIYRAHAAAVRHAVAIILQRYGAAYGGRGTVTEDVADLVQDVFARAFEPGTRRRYDGARSYGPYLYGIARNVVVDFLRRRRRQLRDRLDELGGDAGSDAAMAAGDVPDLFDAELESQIIQCISRLPPDLKRIHAARYVQGLSQRDAAAALGIGRQTIRTLESKLRQHLRWELEQRTASRRRGLSQGRRRQP